MVEKFSGIAFSSNALQLDYLRDLNGLAMNTPYSFAVQDNPVRQKINDLIDYSGYRSIQISHFPAIEDAISSTPEVAILIVDEEVQVTSSIVVPENLTLAFAPAGVLVVADNVEMQFVNAPIWMESKKQIDVTNVTDVTSVSIIDPSATLNPINYGCDPSGIMETTKEWALVNAVLNQNQNTLCIPKGYYRGAYIDMQKSYNIFGQSNPTLVGPDGTIVLNIGGVPFDGFGEYRSYTVAESLVSNLDEGSYTISLASTSGFKVGDTVLIASQTSGASSEHNWIPKKFQYFSIMAKTETTLAFSSPAVDFYTVQDSAVCIRNDRLIQNVTIDGISVVDTNGSYQHYVQASRNVCIRNFAANGYCAFGASVFSENLIYENISIPNSYSGISTARGTISTTFQNISSSLRTENSQKISMFFEESFKKIQVRDSSFIGGSIFATSVDAVDIYTDLSNEERQILIENTFVDSSAHLMTVQTCYHPIRFRDCILRGFGATNVQYGIPNPVLMNFAYNRKAEFFNTYFYSKDASPIFAVGQAGHAPDIDSSCRFGNIEPNPMHLQSVYSRNLSTFFFRTEHILPGYREYFYTSKGSPLGENQTYPVMTMSRPNGVFDIEIQAQCSDSGNFFVYHAKVYRSQGQELNELILNSIGAAMEFTYEIIDANTIHINLYSLLELSDFSFSVRIQENTRYNIIQYALY